jgi:hypothetical protein
MGKIILTALMKLPLMFKGLSVAFISMLEAMARSIDNIGYLIFNPLRTIRFQEVRDFISENAVTISLIIIFIILIYITFSRRVNQNIQDIFVKIH